MSVILKAGDKGPNVKQLQELLNAKLKPSPNLVPDGDFGQKTANAVRAFQKQAHIGVDGDAGPQTMAALRNAKADGATSGGGDSEAGEPEWLTVARKEMQRGVHEISGSQANPRIIAYHATTGGFKSDEVAWCASFVNWCLLQAGRTGTNSAAAISWASYGVSTSARAGAITVLNNPGAANSSLSRSGNHVGFLISESSTHFEILGGNQSDSVKISRFGKGSWRLIAHRWPRGA